MQIFVIFLFHKKIVIWKVTINFSNFSKSKD